jgi:Sulfotransferase family
VALTHSDRLPTDPATTISQKQIVFLVGAPRSGTTWLQLLLSRSARIATANETHLFTGYLRSLYSEWAAQHGNTRPIGLHHFIGEDEFHGMVRRFAADVMARILARKPGADVLLEKTPGHLLYWQDIIKLFPEAGFLHIVRDPRSVVASLVAAANDWGSSWASREVLENCETWIKYITISKSLRGSAAHYMEVKYENLIENGEETLLSIFAWLGISSTRDECRTIISECEIGNLRDGLLEAAPWDLSVEPQRFYRKGATDSWRRELTPREIFLIENTARDLMVEFGYTPVSRPKIIFHLVLKCRLIQALSWRLRALEVTRERALDEREDLIRHGYSGRPSDRKQNAA